MHLHLSDNCVQFILAFFEFFFIFSTLIDLHSKYRVTMRGWEFPKVKMPECLEKIMLCTQFSPPQRKVHC